MRFKVSKDVLSRGIDTIQNIISAKATLPILSNFLLEAQKDTLRLTATDLNIGISCVIPVDIQEQGVITIPARRFSSIIKELSDNEVEVNTKKNNIVIIESKTCQFKIIGLPAEEFPKLPEFKDKEAIKIEQALLKHMLNQTGFAVSLDETRYILNGILFKISKDQLTLVATDGKRLAISKSKLTQPVNKEVSIIVPLKTIQELQRNLKEMGDVSLLIGPNQILFDFKDAVIISRLIEGEFPDYQQVIPPACENKIKINREQFLLAIRRASLLATPDYQAVKFEVFKEKLVISKSTPDVGESREEVPIEYQGKEIVIGFNPVYLIDVLKNLIGEKIDFEILGSEKPGVVRSEGYVYIVLPMRLS
ncbi:MAG: DNA polymerase III subunit beta [Candidatus Omnitrophica bacterium]|nr:DNA polymerase III subunit beta [Candidatus Omnitrophota bacterium]MDD5080022.1 DNA polymerase III subunit beta [Candidatus Omnitrophota bacterium]